MKPFAFLTARPRDAREIFQSEYATIRAYSGLSENDLRPIFLEDSPDVDLHDYSGVFVTGSPFAFTSPVKTDLQKTIENAVFNINRKVLAEDFPYFGICYGLQSLALVLGEELTDQWWEGISARRMTLTDAGRADPIFGTLPDFFHLIVGHNDAVAKVPAGAQLLVTSPTCPIQAIRVGANMYGCQFHPEINGENVDIRFNHYAGTSYYNAADMEASRRDAITHTYTEGKEIVRNFVERYRSA